MTTQIPHRLADNINESCTVGELLVRLVEIAPHIKVHVAITAMDEDNMVTVLGTDGDPVAAAATVMEPLICAVELEDLHFSDDGVMYISVGHEVLDKAFTQGHL